MDKSVAIQGLLNGRLNTLATGQSYTVKWEGQVSDPASGSYLRSWLMLATPRAAALGTLASNLVRGTYQVDVVTDLGGWGAAYTIADKIADHFKRSTRLTVTGVELTCESVATGPAMRQDAKYVLPVSINFYAYVQI